MVNVIDRQLSFMPGQGKRDGRDKLRICLDFQSSAVVITTFQFGNIWFS